MVTSTADISLRRTHRIVLRIGLSAAAVAIILLVGAGAWFYVVARIALPQVDGGISVSGLSARVMVTRDPQGVPHISASTLEDLIFAQGYVTAQDRLWQMDMTRRYAGGELAEVLGPKYVEHDRRQRTLLMRSVAENAAGRLPARDRSFFEAYARGVNACIATQKHLPIEFRILRYRPRPWTVTDAFLVAGSMVQMLNLGTLPHEFSREKITARLSPELAADLYPNSSWRDHPPLSAPGEDEFVPSGEEEQQEEEEQPQRPAPRRRHKGRAPAVPQRRIVKSAQAVARELNSYGTPRAAFGRNLKGFDLRGAKRAAAPPITVGPSTYRIPDSNSEELYPGSNNWVVSGAHTVSGKPLLSNDMHLLHRIPNIWYEAHLSSGGFDVAGVTLPGMPFVIVGHNQRIAWGFTNIEPQVADVFSETFNGAGEYQTPDGWRQPEHRREVIHVRGQADQMVDITISRHGPILGSEQPGETRHLALKWTVYDPDALQVPFFDMDSAQDWQQFREAVRHFTSPAQNVVYADIDGHIGYQATGMIPIRAAGDGSLPVSGADNLHEWTGYIPFDRLPSVLDPPSGIIATANGRITANGYPYVISDEWGPPFRTERIYRVLGSNRKFAPADMLALQTDIYSEFDRFCAERFVYAVDHASHASPRVRLAAELMRNWDGRVTIDSAAATAVARSRGELVRLLLQPRIGDMWQDYRWFMSSVWIENMLLHQPARWLPATYDNWDDLLAAAVDAAVNKPDVPRKLENWRWGMSQPLNLQHPLFATVPLLRHWTGAGAVPQSGNGYTVKQVGSRFGPSERLTVDFSNLDNSTLNIVNGQSGQIFSPHYMDQWRAWYEGTTFPLPFSPAAVDKAKAHQLVLEPSIAVDRRP